MLPCQHPCPEKDQLWRASNSPHFTSWRSKYSMGWPLMLFALGRQYAHMIPCMHACTIDHARVRVYLLHLVVKSRHCPMPRAGLQHVYSYLIFFELHWYFVSRI